MYFSKGRRARIDLSTKKGKMGNEGFFQDWDSYSVAAVCPLSDYQESGGHSLPVVNPYED